MTINTNDPTRNGIEEHDRYDEIMHYYIASNNNINI